VFSSRNPQDKNPKRKNIASNFSGYFHPNRRKMKLEKWSFLCFLCCVFMYVFFFVHRLIRLKTFSLKAAKNVWCRSCSR